MSCEMDDVQLVHADALRPEGEYDDRPLEWFVGRAVKMAFASAGGTTEHMWVEVKAVEGDRLVGALDSEPVVVRHLRRGDRVELGRGQVEAVCGRRVRKVYLRGEYFGCRHCHNLAYASSQESDSRVYAALRPPPRGAPPRGR